MALSLNVLPSGSAVHWCIYSILHVKVTEERRRVIIFNLVCRNGVKWAPETILFTWTVNQTRPIPGQTRLVALIRLANGASIQTTKNHLTHEETEVAFFFLLWFLFWDRLQYIAQNLLSIKNLLWSPNRIFSNILSSCLWRFSCRITGMHNDASLMFLLLSFNVR